MSIPENQDGCSQFIHSCVCRGEEANHTFSGQAADICGHRSAIRTGECTYDATPPEVEVCVKDADYFIPYRSYQYFGKKKFVISITAKDTISGARTLSYYLKEEGQGGLPEESSVLFQNEKENVRTDDLSEYTREIVIDQEDFRGRICVQAGDFEAGKVRRRKVRVLFFHPGRFIRKTAAFCWNFLRRITPMRIEK